MTYNLLKTYIAAALTTLTLAACSESEAPTEPGQPAAGIIRFSVGVGNETATRGYTTDTYSGTTHNTPYQWVGEEQVAIKLKSNINSANRGTSTYETKVFNYDADQGKLVPGTDNYFFWVSAAETVSDIRVWSYGTRGTAADAMKTDPIDQPFQLDADQNADPNYVRELMYGAPKKSISFTDEVQRIPLYHQCARLVIKVQYDEDTDPNSTGLVTSVTQAWVGSPSASSAGQRLVPIRAKFGANRLLFDENYGTWYQTGTTTALADNASGTGDNFGLITMRDDATGVTGTPTKAAPKVFSAVVMPCTYVANAPLFTVKVSKSYRNPDNSANITDDYYAYVPQTAQQVKMGNQYTYTLTLKDTRLVLESVTVTDWQEGTAPSTELTGTGVYTVGGVTFRMMPVPGGDFTMDLYGVAGPSAYLNKTYTVAGSLSDYYIAETQTTNALWNAVMGSKPTGQRSSADNAPVARVERNKIIGSDRTGTAADCFIKKLNDLTVSQRPAGWKFTLPSEMQWKYAQRGGAASQGYRYAGSNTATEVIQTNSSISCSDANFLVKQKAPNELGIYDMSGMLQEFVLDDFDSYSGWTAGGTKNVGKDYVYRVSGSSFTCMRCNGSYANPATWNECKTRVDGWSNGADGHEHVGFRLALVRETTDIEPQVGHLYFSDGSWGTLTANTSGKTKNAADAIGVVFSTEPSDNDRRMGYTHGYVVALKFAGTYTDGNPEKFAWGATDATKTTQVTDKLNDNCDYSAVDGDAFKDMDGLTHSATARANAESSATYTMADLPAFWAASYYYNNVVKAPAVSSGWYLPSFGQLFSLFVNAGLDLSDNLFQYQSGLVGPYGALPSSGTLHIRAADDSKRLNAAVSTINGWMGGTSFDPLPAPASTVQYMTSTEVTAAYYWYLQTTSDSTIDIDWGEKQNGRYVRPVLAF